MQGNYTSDLEKSSPVTAEIIAGFQQLAPNVLDGPVNVYTQEQGRVAIANKVAESGASLGAPPAVWGNPTGNSQPTSDGFGRIQTFQGGTIYWSPATAQFDNARGLNPTTAGARLIAGIMHDKFLMFGGTSALGYPTNDTSNLPGRPGATSNDFYNPATKITSSLVYSLGDGEVVSGAIRTKWISLGAGVYGVPDGPQYFTSSRYNTQGV